MSRATAPRIDTASIFEEARTHAAWLDEPVDEAVLRDLYDKMKWGPTSVNSGPARIVFVTSAEGKAKLLPTLSPGNIDKTRAAPVTAIIAYDAEFFELLPRLFPHADVKPMFAGNPRFAEDTARYNTAMQSAYFILAARSLGLDAGPMAGFDAAKVDEAFFAKTSWKTSLVVNLGYGDQTKLFPRGPRLSFDEACRIV